MIYLEKFVFPDKDAEWKFFMSRELKLNCYTSYYPFQILSKNMLRQLDFEPVTILSGSNGSGKSTALNVIAEKLMLTRDSAYNKTNFYQNYVDLCTPYISEAVPSYSRIITSDDVFDYMLNLRNINQGVDNKRDDVFEEYYKLKLSGEYSDFTMKTMDDYDTLKKLVTARRKTKSAYTRQMLPSNIKEHSNGESAFMYFSEKIKDGGLYLLDEPENSLSAERQTELVSFIEEASRYYNCQFIISTHSVFLMSVKSAKIYDFDASPVDVKHWSDLKIVKTYYDFFEKHKYEFE